MIQVWFGLTHKQEKSDFLYSGIFSTAKQTRDDAERSFGRPWKRLYQDGYRVCKVEVKLCNSHREVPK